MGKGALNVFSQGSVREPMILPNSNSLSISDKPSHHVTEQLCPKGDRSPYVGSSGCLRTSEQGHLGEVFIFKDRAYREEGVEYRRQAWFMRIAWFLCRVEVIPSPPDSLGSVTVSQLTV